MALGLAGTIVLGYGIASACSMRSSRVQWGFLGLEGGVASALAVPRNVAVVETFSSAELLDEEGFPIELEPVEGAPWLRPLVPLVPSARVSSVGVGATVEDVLDEEAPTAPTLEAAWVNEIERARGCLAAESSCAGAETLVLEGAAAEDDFSAPERLTYAVYLGATAQEATDASLPRLLLADTFVDGRLSEPVSGADVDGARWVALATVDQAGNLSARTPAVPLTR